MTAVHCQTGPLGVRKAMSTALLATLKQAGQDAGGEAGVEKILTAFYLKMSKDLLIGFFFHGKDLGHIVEQQKFFLCRAMGLVAEYTGKSPREAHRQLPPILKGHFDRRLILLRETLTEFHLPETSVQAWVDFEETFRKGIVEDEGPLSGRTKYRDR